MIRTIDMSVLMPRSLEIQQSNQNAINARSDIKQEAFSQQMQEKTVNELKQVTNSNKSEQQQMINKDGRNSSGGGSSQKRKNGKKEEKPVISNANYRGRILPMNTSTIDLQL